MYADRYAVVVGNVAITYAQFLADIERAVNHLRSNLPDMQARVGITVVSHYWHWVATMAAFRLGVECASVPRSAMQSSDVASHFDVWFGEFSPPGKKHVLFQAPNDVSELEGVWGDRGEFQSAKEVIFHLP